MEKREHLNEVAGAKGVMSVTFDIATGQVHAYGSGFWTGSQARAYFEDWRLLIRRIHEAGVSVSAFVDMAESAVQNAEVVDIIANATIGIYLPGDSVALLQPTSLATMQMRRVLDDQFHRIFSTRHAAEAWLASRTILNHSQTWTQG